MSVGVSCMLDPPKLVSAFLEYPTQVWQQFWRVRVTLANKHDDWKALITSTISIYTNMCDIIGNTRISILKQAHK